jgi:hypothetical protein
LALPDLEQSKAVVLNTLTSKKQRTYDCAITDFVDWYCSEPRLAFNRTVVLRYRIYLEQKLYAPTTINLRLAAVRRVAYAAADSGLLSPELAAGIRRVKGVRRIGIRVGNWLTVDQGKRLLAATESDSLRDKRNYAILAMLIGCGLRRGELLALRVDAIQLRDEHDAPGPLAIAHLAPNSLIQNRRIVLDPAPDGHMVHGETPLRHDLLQVTIGERVSPVPANAQKNDHVFEMAPAEQCWPFSGHDTPYQITAIRVLQHNRSTNSIGSARPRSFPLRGFFWGAGTADRMLFIIGS